MSESLRNGDLLLAAARLYKEPQWQIQSDLLLHASCQEADTETRTPGLFFCGCWSGLTFSERKKKTQWTIVETMKERRNTQPLVVRCKLVLVGDVQCGKTAMLQVLAKDCYPEVCANVAHYCGEMKIDAR